MILYDNIRYNLYQYDSKLIVANVLVTMLQKLKEEQGQIIEIVLKNISYMV